MAEEMIFVSNIPIEDSAKEDLDHKSELFKSALKSSSENKVSYILKSLEAGEDFIFTKNM